MEQENSDCRSAAPKPTGSTRDGQTYPLAREELPQTAPSAGRDLPGTSPLSASPGENGRSGDDPYIQVAQRSDIGLVRSRNEDTCFSFVAQAGGSDPLIPFALCLVADGMGGHHDGHLASRRVTYQIAQHVLDQVYLPLTQGKVIQTPIQEIMSRAIESANQILYASDPEKEGGTTLTGVLIIGRRLYLVHVGDTRAYFFVDDDLKLLTTDHSVVKRLEEAGHLTAEEAAEHPQRNMLYRALTGHELEIDTYTRSLPHAGQIFLCSDGLWGSVPDKTIRHTLQQQELTLQKRVEDLVDLALSNGSDDNVTGLLIDFRLR